VVTSTAAHGRRSRYTAGCRCPRCSEAHRDYQRELQAKRRAHGLPSDDPRHGTMTGYDNHGCRCPRCRAAAQHARLKRRQAAVLVAARVRKQALDLMPRYR
jgi:Zn ribbon nucleic-acid-binding protein